MSLTSLASATMMGSMGHGHLQDQMEVSEVPCEHHMEMEGMADLKEQVMISMHGTDTDSDDMMTCGMCSLCTSIIHLSSSNLVYHRKLTVWETPDLTGVLANPRYTLDKPPRS